MKRFAVMLFMTLFSSIFFATAFNDNLTETERKALTSGDLIIKNQKNVKKLSLEKGKIPSGDILLNDLEQLKPKYLAEVIQFKPYKGNENLPEKLENVLYNISDYVGIPYYSVQTGKWHELYESAEILETQIIDNKKLVKADLFMQPFHTINERIEIETNEDSFLYIATNTNKLQYHEEFDCIWPEKMKTGIILFREGDYWILYGIGAVNVPRIPLLGERIQTSLLNRINTFCTYIFKKF